MLTLILWSVGVVAALYLAWAVVLAVKSRGDAPVRDVVLRKWRPMMGVAVHATARAMARLRRRRQLGAARAAYRAVAGSFLLRKIAGVFGACIRGVNGWWAAQLVSWDALIGTRPTLARTWPALAKWYAALRLIASSPRAVLATGALLLALFGAPAAAFAMGPIRYLNSHQQVNNLTLDGTAGQRQTLDLEQNRAIKFLQVRVTATVDIAAVNGVAVRNLGLAEALLSEIGVAGGGDGDIVNADPIALAYSSEYMLAATATDKTRLASPNIGTTSVSSHFRIWFENPQSVRPRETIFLQKEPNSRLQFFATLSTAVTGAGTSTAGSGRVVQGAGGSVVTVSSIVCSVQQINDTGLAELPYFRPRVSQVQQPVAAVGSDVQVLVPVETNEYLRGLTIMFVDATDLVLPTTNATQFTLKGDNFDYVGGGIKVNTGNYVLGQQFASAGNTALYAGKCIHFNFQTDGRLSHIYNPSQDTNLRFLFNVPALPATGLRVIVVKHSLMRDKYVRADGTRVVSEFLPPELAEPAAVAA